MNTLQFGTGRFLRGFWAPLVATPQAIGVVQSRTDSEGARALDQAPQGYGVWVRGHGPTGWIDEREEVTSIARVLSANSDWDQLRAWAGDPDIVRVVSNTTEQGLSLDPLDDAGGAMTLAPRSFPAKLAVCLRTRWAAGAGGWTIVPLELLEHNGTRLRDLVVEQVARWSRVPGDPHGWRQIQTDFGAWLHHANRWLTTLVDRMVVRLPESAEASAADPAGVLTEPYWLLAVQDDGGPREILPQRQSRLNEPVVNWVPDLSIYYLRKVRILNGLHTAMVAMAGERGWGATVAEVLSNAAAREWLQELLQEEILPVLRPRVPDVDAYAAAIWRRLENPAFQHRLADIALNHSAKLAVRLQPTFLEFQSLFGRTPPRLAALCSRSAESECAR